VTDYRLFAAAMGRRGALASDLIFDHDGDGDVDATDFVQFRARYTKTLVPPG
jgi:hypothetical protein